MRILPTAILVFVASLVTCVQGRAQAAPAGRRQPQAEVDVPLLRALRRRGPIRRAGRRSSQWRPTTLCLQMCR